MSVKASIISPCYNHGKYIFDMLDSVLSQTFQDFEVVIVNDGSTDDSREILDCIHHEKVRVFHTKHYGPAHARNLAINHAQGEIILNLDADDKIAQHFLEQCVPVFDSHPNAGIVYSDVERFGARSGRFEVKEYSIENMLYANCIVANSCFRKDDWNITSGYSEELVYGLEDYDFWLSIIELGREVFKINKPLVFYRTYNDQEASRTGRMNKCKKRINKTSLQVFHRHETLYRNYPQIWDYFSKRENQFCFEPVRSLLRFFSRRTDCGTHM